MVYRNRDYPWKHESARLMAKRGTSLAIYRVLKEKGSATITEISQATGHATESIRRQVAEMIFLEVVDFRRKGKVQKVYFLTIAGDRLGKLENIVKHPTWIYRER